MQHPFSASKEESCQALFHSAIFPQWPVARQRRLCECQEGDITKDNMKAVGAQNAASLLQGDQARNSKLGVASLYQPSFQDPGMLGISAGAGEMGHLALE